MKTNKILEALEPRQIKIIAAGLFAVVGLTLAIVAFGATADQATFTQQVVQAVSNGPVGDAVQSMYIK